MVVKKPNISKTIQRSNIVRDCAAHGLPEPVFEYRFNELDCDGVVDKVGGKARKWRFDLLFNGWLAVEIQGGVWIRGRHSRGKGQINDMEKMNAAQKLGYVVLQYTPEDVKTGKMYEELKEFLADFFAIKERGKK